MAKTKSDRIAANYYVSTHPVLLICVFLAMFSFFLRDHEAYYFTPLQIWIICVITLIAALYYILKWMSPICFTPEGIEFYFLFWNYRSLPWSRVKQVGTAKQYNATRISIVITPDNCPMFDTSTKQNTIYVERYHFKLIRLDATKHNLEMVKRFYGDLDYKAEVLEINMKWW